MWDAVSRAYLVPNTMGDSQSTVSDRVGIHIRGSEMEMVYLYFSFIGHKLIQDAS